MQNTYYSVDKGIKALSISTITDEYCHSKIQETPLRNVDDATNGPRENDHVAYMGINSREKILTSDAPPRMLTQVIGAMVVALTHLGIGAAYGFPGVTLPQLTDIDGEDLYLSPSFASLFGSVVNVGAIFGGLSVGPLISRIGLRKSMLVSLPVTLGFWLMMAFSPNVITLIVSRACLGIMTATVSPPSNTYVLEISHKEKRGLLFAAIPTTRQVGFLFAYMFGITHLTWRYIAIICGVVTTILPFIGIFFLPESPRWLASQGRIDEARISLVFYRGIYYDSESELNTIIKEVQQFAKINSQCDQIRQLFKQSSLKMLMILSFLTVIVGFNGSFAVNTYLVPIFQLSSSNIDAYTCAILVGAIRVVGTLCYLVFIDNMGRRPLHISSYVMVFITHAILGGYFYVQHLEWVTNNLSWLPLADVMVYTFFVGLGQPVLTMMHGELLSTNVRSIGMSFLISLMFLGAFLVTQSFSAMMDTMGAHGTFWFYSAMCLAVAVFSYFAVPETKGLSLEEISHKLKKGNRQMEMAKK